MEKYDVIVIGGGAAGITSAIFTSRKKLRTLIITIDMGGQNLLTEHEENYPGYLESSGPKLMKIFETQAKRFGADFTFGKTKSVEKHGSNFIVATAHGEKYECRVLILAYGKVPRTLGIKGEEELLGRGVSTSSTFDAPKFAGKNVAVVGGGNSALEAAVSLADIASHVYLVHRRDAFRADEITVENVRGRKNVTFVLNSVPSEIEGHDHVTGLVTEDVNTKEKKHVNLDGVFIEIGFMVDTSMIQHLVSTNHEKEVVINKYCETSCPGIFAAGDITDTPYKQTATAVGLGATAGLSAYNYICKLDGKPGAKIDWN